MPIQKPTTKEYLTDMLELPRDVVLNYPKIIIMANKEIYIENFKGIIEYSNEKIRLNTKTNMLSVEGKNLSIKNITADIISVNGIIKKVEFI